MLFLAIKLIYPSFLLLTHLNDANNDLILLLSIKPLLCAKYYESYRSPMKDKVSSIKGLYFRNTKLFKKTCWALAYFH